ncbi:MAG: DNRLRE domain-containing protein [Chloroflexi bacterium]|nr:DNRLRE domain-containing protein [Chloroflexota bacterium]
MKKKFALFIMLALLLFFFVPHTLQARTPQAAYGIGHSALGFVPWDGTMTPKDNPKITSALYQLVRLASNGNWAQVQRYANHWGLRIENQQIRVVLEVKSDALAAFDLLAREMGLQVEAIYRNHVQVLAPVTSLLHLADQPWVHRVRPPYYPFPLAVTSEGVAITAANTWHAAGLVGNGVKVAVIDLGFQNYTALQASGELPVNLVARSFRSDGNIEASQVHGSACAEIIYDMAPGAQLYLLNFETDVEFGNAVDYAIAQGAKVISCSIGWLGAGPFDGTGPICDIVNHARDHGVFWAQAAGNAANKHWEGPWYDPDGNGRHNFSLSDETQSFTAAAYTTIQANLVWNDPWGASSNNYDLYLYDANNQLVASSTDWQNGDDFPSEFIYYNVGPAGGTYHLVIQRYSATGTAQLELYSFQQLFEYRVPASSLIIPADAGGAVATGATYWVTDALESFSSRGPANDGRSKPEFSAPDGVSSAAYGGSFFGTSAAAPHLAGAAVLVRGVYPGYTVTDTVTFLAQRAVDRGIVGRDNEYGYGRISLGVAPSTPTPTLTATTTPTLTPTVPTPSPTPTASVTPTPTRTFTPTPTLTPGGATTITLQYGLNGYIGAEDTYIYQYEPDKTNSSASLLKVGYKQQNAALLRFDLSPIPPNAPISQATLYLYAAGWSGADSTLGVYYITRTVTLSQATWNRAQDNNPWGSPGCNDTTSDRRALPESTVQTAGIRRWYGFNLTSVVQGWADGSLENNGVLVRTMYPAFTGTFQFTSAESSTPDLRPKLVITYRIAGDPTPTPSASSTPFLIIGHITDAHIGRNEFCSTCLINLVRLISQHANVMVDTGDCTENGLAGETIEYKQHVDGNITIPWRAVMGNHDTPSIFTAYIGPLEWSWDVGGYRLIGINSEAINYTALDNALTNEKPCIIFGHFPLSVYNTQDQDKLRQRFKAYNVLLYVAGHAHLDSWEIDPYSGTRLLVGHWACGNHYRLITLRGTNIEVAFY